MHIRVIISIKIIEREAYPMTHPTAEVSNYLKEPRRQSLCTHRTGLSGSVIVGTF